MSTTYPYSSVDTLSDITFLAGTNQDLYFNIYNSASALVDLSGATITWKLAPYGRTTSLVTKTGTYTGSPVGQFKISIAPSDTSTLAYGRYTQAYTIIDSSGSTFKAQGPVLIGADIT